MIQKRYMDIIIQCEGRIDDLSSWEQGFILGDPEDSKKPPLKTKSYLSTKQKETLDKIVCVRFEGKKWDKNRSIVTKFGNIEGKQTDDGWKIHVNGNPVGQGMAKVEVPVIACWLNDALSEILQLSEKEVGEYGSTKGGMTEAEEVDAVIDGRNPMEEQNDNQDDMEF